MRTTIATIVLVVMATACGGGGGDDGGDDDGTTIGPGGPYFPQGAFWDQDVSMTTPASNSDAQIAALRAAGGWGNGDVFQIDFSIEVLQVAGATPEKRTFNPTGDFYEPDCDNVPMPVPPGGNIEGESGYECVGDGDCHLIVWAPDERRLYEMWRANIVGNNFDGGCLAVWDTSRVYGPEGRGIQCTSADAAGFPIAPLLFTADEVAAGRIDHAIRFILPNNRPQVGFVPPATHGTNTTGGANAVYYGVHLRLRADFPLDTLPSEGARVVARALQRYGMYHADGGNIALTAAADTRTTAKWDGLLEPRDLSALEVEDFDVIDHGPPIELTYDCQR
jgi:serine/threonine-protein kinase